MYSTNESVSVPLQGHLAAHGLTDSKYALTTDDVLPILIYVAIQANLKNQVTASRYLSYFNSSTISTTELGFHLANYQAAVEYLLKDQLEAHAPPPPRRKQAVSKSAAVTFSSPIDSPLLCPIGGLSASLDDDTSENSSQNGDRPKNMACSPDSADYPSPVALTDLLPELKGMDGDII